MIFHVFYLLLDCMINGGKMVSKKKKKLPYYKFYLHIIYNKKRK